MFEFRVDPAVAPHAGAGVLVMADAHVAAGDVALDDALREFESRAADAGPSIPDARSLVRAMYRRFGVDPTKTRPSSEALRRRLAKGEPLPRINTAVDVCNWLSAECELPYGLYDADRIEGHVVTLRAGREGEEYAGIRKDTVHVTGRLVVADAAGAFGNPTSDSARTSVEPGRRALLVVVYAPRAVSEVLLDRVIDATSERLVRFTGAVEHARARC